MIADTAKRHSKRSARYATMPMLTRSSASAPFSYSSLPTCGPTNSTRCWVTCGSSPRSADITCSESCAVDKPSFSGRRISALLALPNVCTANSPRPSLSMAARIPSAEPSPEGGGGGGGGGAAAGFGTRSGSHSMIALAGVQKPVR